MADFPMVTLKNADVELAIHLPNLEEGSYRATRFDHAGLIHSVRYRGMEYFSQWLDAPHDPFSHEAVNGPVDSYGVLGYGDSDSFVRIGVGVLSKPAGETEFRWNHTYEITDFGTWQWKVNDKSIQFEQVISGPDGWAFVYRKTVHLTQHGFRLEYHLNNTGSQDITTDVYNHNFVSFENLPMDSQYVLEVPYNLTAAKVDPRVQLQGGELQLLVPILTQEENLFMQLNGSPHISDHRIAVRHSSSGRGLEISMDQPMSRLVVWANNRALAPENFIDVHVPAKESRHWCAEYKLL
eukprot:TRINITY_DN37175_c0_g1_i1.p1 TRINITY_DN37175_c0_g1~~TRINITY_DN37175_c0_g1_i1.p1  ORF type:complete len:320 (+),score=40.18 TRINITY_DN37175_c0_g1_i1:76-960(+)